MWRFGAVWCQRLLQWLDVFVVYISETCCHLPCRSAHGPLTLAECSAADCLSVMVNVSRSSLHFEPPWFHSLSWHQAQAGQYLHFICLHTHICLFIKRNPQKENGPLTVYRLAGSTRGLHVKTPHKYCSEHVFMPLATLFGYNQICMLLHCTLGLYDSGRNSLNVIGLLNEVMFLACVGVRSSELKHSVLLSLFSQWGWERIIETNGAFNRNLSPSACHVEYVVWVCARVQMRGCVCRWSKFVCALISAVEFLCRLHGWAVLDQWFLNYSGQVPGLIRSELPGNTCHNTFFQ